MTGPFSKGENQALRLSMVSGKGPDVQTRPKTFSPTRMTLSALVLNRHAGRGGKGEGATKGGRVLFSVLSDCRLITE